MAKEKKQRKGRRPAMVVLAVIGSIFALFILLGLVALGVDLPAQKKIRAAELEPVDFTTVPDGTYRGTYQVAWRNSTVDVTVQSGRVTEVEIIQPTIPGNISSKLKDELITSQSIDIDTISGASITTKLFQLGVDEALTDRHPAPVSQ